MKGGGNEFLYVENIGGNACEIKKYNEEYLQESENNERSSEEKSGRKL